MVGKPVGKPVPGPPNPTRLVGFAWRPATPKLTVGLPRIGPLVRVGKILPKREEASASQSTNPGPPPVAPEGTGRGGVKVIGPPGLPVTDGTGPPGTTVAESTGPEMTGPVVPEGKGTNEDGPEITGGTPVPDGKGAEMGPP